MRPKSRKMSREISNKTTDSTNRQQQHRKLKPFSSAHTIYTIRFISSSLKCCPPSTRPRLRFYVAASNVTWCEFAAPERNKSPLIRFVVVISLFSFVWLSQSEYAKMRPNKMRFGQYYKLYGAGRSNQMNYILFP